jgi:predicted metal-dependent enzyme (double-stranded beta helix superfamily)
MFSIDQLIADCLDAVGREGRRGGVAVKEVVERAVSDPNAIEAAIGPASDAAVFSTWFNSDELTVLHVVWPPGVDLFAHDHRMWASIGLYGGREDNRFFRPLPEGDLEPRGVRTMQRGDTILLGDDTVHAVANPSKEWTGAIHVYGGDYFISGRRMWLEPGRAPIEFDAAQVMSVLDDAARRAGRVASP